MSVLDGRKMVVSFDIIILIDFVITYNNLMRECLKLLLLK